MISLHLKYFSRNLTILLPSPLLLDPMNLNLSPSPFDVEQINEVQDFSCQVFFDSTDRDHTKFCNHHQFYQPYHHPEDDCYSYNYHGGSFYDDDTNNKVDDNGLKLTLWSDPVKWKPSRVEPMQEKKMNPEEDRVTIKINTSACRNKVRDQDQKLQPSSSLETDLSSNSSGNIVNNSPTIRVCSDCNTTKTPLWRSGPKGPKSLCNACGIRQRKARRAMAAAAAAAGMPATADPPPPILKIKVQQQNKQKISKIGHGQDSKFKKRSKITATAAGSSSSSSGPKKLNFEDFLIKLSKNLAFQRVFPQDEKDAAILLMALSSGLVHG